MTTVWVFVLSYWLAGAPTAGYRTSEVHMLDTKKACEAKAHEQKHRAGSRGAQLIELRGCFPATIGGPPPDEKGRAR